MDSCSNGKTRKNLVKKIQAKILEGIAGTLSDCVSTNAPIAITTSTSTTCANDIKNSTSVLVDIDNFYPNENKNKNYAI